MVIDTRGQLIQSAKDLRRSADQEKISMAQVQHELDEIKKTVQVTHNRGASAGNTENVMHNLERQVRDMQKEIQNLERQAKDMNKQALRY